MLQCLWLGSLFFPIEIDDEPKQEVENSKLQIDDDVTDAKKSRCGALTVLTNRAFVFYLVFVGITDLGSTLFYKYSPTRAANNGLDPQKSAFLPSAVALVSSLFRVIASVVGNMKWVNLPAICGCASLGFSVILCVSSLADTFRSYAFLSGLFGACTGMITSLRLVTSLTNDDCLLQEPSGR